jgi:hypothetical protein
MTASQFEMLNTGEKETLACLQGSFIGVRQEPEFIIRLYQLDSFYVELYYHQVKDSAVCARSFESTVKLEPYLSGIDVSEIIGKY